MVRTLLVASLLAAACGKVSHPGGNGDGGTGDGDGGGGADANPITDLSVTVEVGTGSGNVQADAGDIDCGSAGSSCEATLATGTEVTLTATPDEFSSFVAWRGAGRDCRRAPECTITLTGGPQEVGALFAEKGTAGWALQVGSSVYDAGGQILIDKNGDLLFVASYGGLFSFGGEEYENQGEQDIFLAKLSPGGEVIWAKGFGGTGYDTPAFIVPDPTTGDVVLGGYYQSPIDLGGSELLDIADSEDLFVAKLAGADGALLWQKPIEVSDNDGPGFEGLAVDGDGDVIVLGHFNTSVNLGAATLTSTDQEMFFAKLHGGDGTVDWQRKMGGLNYPIPAQMVVDGIGNPIIVGRFSDTIDFDGVAGNDMTALGVTDAFVAKFAAGNGSLTWQKQIGGSEDNDGGGNDTGNGIALGPNNSVVVVVNYRVMAGQSVQFLGNTLSGTGTGIDLVVGRISAAGSFVWAKRYGGSGQDYGYKPAVFQDGRVAVAGYFTADFDMNGHALALEGAPYDSYFAVLGAANGSATWAARVGSGMADNATWTAGFDDQLYGTGNFQGDGSFLGKTLTNVGVTDAYLFMVPLP